MDLFVPAKPPLGVQDKAAGPKNPGWLQGTANAVMRAQGGPPGWPRIRALPALSSLARRPALPSSGPFNKRPTEC